MANLDAGQTLQSTRDPRTAIEIPDHVLLKEYLDVQQVSDPIVTISPQKKTADLVIR